MKNSIVIFLFSTGSILFLEICSKNQNCLLKLKFRIQINLNMQNSMVIFIFLVRKYPFCVNLIQKFKRVILRRNLVPTLECLIDVSPLPPSPPINFSMFSPPEHSFSTPFPRLLIIGESFQPEFETIYCTYADFFLRSRKRSDPSAEYFVLQVHSKSPTQCFVL